MTLSVDGAFNMSALGGFAIRLLTPGVILDRQSKLGGVLHWIRSHLVALVPGSMRNTEVHILAKDLKNEQVTFKGERVFIRLCAPENVYTRSVSIPKSNAQSHERMVDLMLHSLAPTNPQTLMCTGVTMDRKQDGAQTYRIAMARRKDLEHLSGTAKKKGAKDVRFIVEGHDARQTIDLYAPTDIIIHKTRLVADLTLVLIAIGSLYWFGGVWEKYETQHLGLARQIDARLSKEARSAIIQERTDAAARDALAATPLLRRPGKAILDISTLNSLTPDAAYWRGAEWTPEALTVQLNAKDGADVVRVMTQEDSPFEIEVISDITATTSNRQNVRIRATASGLEGAQQ